MAKEHKPDALLQQLQRIDKALIRREEPRIQRLISAMHSGVDVGGLIQAEVDRYNKQFTKDSVASDAQITELATTLRVILEVGVRVYHPAVQGAVLGSMVMLSTELGKQHIYHTQQDTAVGIDRFPPFHPIKLFLQRPESYLKRICEVRPDTADHEHAGIAIESLHATARYKPIDTFFDIRLLLPVITQYLVNQYGSVYYGSKEYAAHPLLKEEYRADLAARLKILNSHTSLFDADSVRKISTPPLMQHLYDCLSTFVPTTDIRPYGAALAETNNPQHATAERILRKNLFHSRLPHALLQAMRGYHAYYAGAAGQHFYTVPELMLGAPMLDEQAGLIRTIFEQIDDVYGAEATQAVATYLLHMRGYTDLHSRRMNSSGLYAFGLQKLNELAVYQPRPEIGMLPEQWCEQDAKGRAIQQVVTETKWDRNPQEGLPELPRIPEHRREQFDTIVDALASDIREVPSFRALSWKKAEFTLSPSCRVHLAIDTDHKPAMTVTCVGENSVFEWHLNQDLQIAESIPEEHKDLAAVIRALCIAEAHDMTSLYAPLSVVGEDLAKPEKKHSKPAEGGDTDASKEPTDKPLYPPRKPRTRKFHHRYVVIGPEQRPDQSNTEPQQEIIDIELQKGPRGEEVPALRIEHVPHWRETDIPLVRASRQAAWERLIQEPRFTEMELNDKQQVLLQRALLKEDAHRATARHILMDLLSAKGQRRPEGLPSISVELRQHLIERYSQLEQEEYQHRFEAKYLSTEEARTRWERRQTEIHDRRQKDEEKIYGIQTTHPDTRLNTVGDPWRPTMTYVPSSSVRHPLVMRNGVGETPDKKHRVFLGISARDAIMHLLSVPQSEEKK
ncbi:MAG: hypothetical protein HYV32_06760 [Candidatus Kerfeldbacteria bacterium]|nr:hypothetical protein [Candidatus Kerfeldbacteria bacterium]